MAEQNGRDLAGEQFLIDARLAGHTINRSDEQSSDTPRQETPDASLFALGDVLCVRQQEIVAELISPFFDRQHHPGEDRVGWRRNGQAE